MIGGWRRGLAALACRMLVAALPAAWQAWGHAVRSEAAAITDDREALRFVLGSLIGLLPRALAAHLLRPFLARPDAIPDGGTIPMPLLELLVRRPRALGLACASGAVALGLFYLVIAAAPLRYLVVNAAAWGIGLALLAMLGRLRLPQRAAVDGALVAMGAALLLTALLGDAVDGAVRWVRLGGIAVQPSLILLPLMLVLFARTRTLPATAGIMVATLAMALQPDRAMAGMLVLALAVLAILRPHRAAITAAATSLLGLATTLARPDALPAVPYVDQIFYTAFAVHPAAGLAVLLGAALLLVPAMAGWHCDRMNRATYAAFGAVWLAAVIAAALGNYPTPIVGYGGSAIIGYALSLLALPLRLATDASMARPAAAAAGDPRGDRHLRVGLT